MVIKVYISGNSGNKEIVTHQQRIFMILNSLGIENAPVDIAGPGMEEARDYMRGNGKKKEGERNVLPPQIFNEEKYCGDYDDFDIANEDDLLEEFLGLPKKEPLGTPAPTGVTDEDASKLPKEEESPKTTEETEEPIQEKSEEVQEEPEESPQEPQPLEEEQPDKEEEEKVPEPPTPKEPTPEPEPQEKVPEVEETDINENNRLPEEKEELKKEKQDDVLLETVIDDPNDDTGDSSEEEDEEDSKSKGIVHPPESPPEPILRDPKPKPEAPVPKKKFQGREVQEELSFPKGCTKLQPYSSEAVDSVKKSPGLASFDESEERSGKCGFNNLTNATKFWKVSTFMGTP